MAMNDWRKGANFNERKRKQSTKSCAWQGKKAPGTGWTAEVEVVSVAVLMPTGVSLAAFERESERASRRRKKERKKARSNGPGRRNWLGSDPSQLTTSAQLGLSVPCRSKYLSAEIHPPSRRHKLAQVQPSPAGQVSVIGETVSHTSWVVDMRIRLFSLLSLRLTVRNCSVIVRHLCRWLLFQVSPGPESLPFAVPFAVSPPVSPFNWILSRTSKPADPSLDWQDRNTVMSSGSTCYVRSAHDQIETPQKIVRWELRWKKKRHLRAKNVRGPKSQRGRSSYRSRSLARAGCILAPLQEEPCEERGHWRITKNEHQPKKREPCNKRNGIYFISMGHEQLPPVGPPPRSAPSNDWKIGESSQIIVNFRLWEKGTDKEADGEAIIQSQKYGDGSMKWDGGPLLIVWLVLGMSTVFCCCELARCWRPFFFYFFSHPKRFLRTVLYLVASAVPPAPSREAQSSHPKHAKNLLFEWEYLHSSPNWARVLPLAARPPVPLAHHHHQSEKPVGRGPVAASSLSAPPIITFLPLTAFPPRSSSPSLLLLMLPAGGVGPTTSHIANFLRNRRLLSCDCLRNTCNSC